MSKTLLFQGDSITDCGRYTCGGAGYPMYDLGPGYAGIIATTLLGEQPEKDWKIINRGYSGHRIVDLYERWKHDTININPDILSMLIGINDVGHEFAHKNGVDEERFDAFYKCSDLTKIILPENLESISFWAFTHCSKLTEINFPEKLTAIGASAFERCSSLKEVTLPDSVTQIDDFAFTKYASLQKVVIGDGVTKIGARAFAECETLDNVKIEDHVEAIGNSCFADCCNLRKVYIGSRVKKLGLRTFYKCDNLEEVHLSVNTKFKEGTFPCS